MVTARDVAERAGVSTSTVSHVLNGTRIVSDELRTRVLEAAHDLGYEANAVARSLKTRRSHTIALITPDIGNPFFTSVVRGVEDVTGAAGYGLILCNTGEDPQREEAYLRMLGAQRVDGLDPGPPRATDYPYLDRLLHTKTAIVLLDRVLSPTSRPCGDAGQRGRCPDGHAPPGGPGPSAHRARRAARRHQQRGGAHRGLPDGAGAVGHRVRPGAGPGRPLASWRRPARPRPPCWTCPTGPRR